jgi:hypothetical protein
MKRWLEVKHRDMDVGTEVNVRLPRSKTHRRDRSVRRSRPVMVASVLLLLVASGCASKASSTVAGSQPSLAKPPTALSVPSSSATPPAVTFAAARQAVCHSLSFVGPHLQEADGYTDAPIPEVLSNHFSQDISDLDGLIYGDFVPVYPDGVLDALQTLQLDIQQMSTRAWHPSLDGAETATGTVLTGMSCDLQGLTFGGAPSPSPFPSPSASSTALRVPGLVKVLWLESELKLSQAVSTSEVQITGARVVQDPQQGEGILLQVKVGYWVPASKQVEYAGWTFLSMGKVAKNLKADFAANPDIKFVGIQDSPTDRAYVPVSTLLDYANGIISGVKYLGAIKVL